MGQQIQNSQIEKKKYKNKQNVRSWPLFKSRRQDPALESGSDMKDMIKWPLAGFEQGGLGQQEMGWSGLYVSSEKDGGK